MDRKSTNKNNEEVCLRCGDTLSGWGWCPVCETKENSKKLKKKFVKDLKEELQTTINVLNNTKDANAGITDLEYRMNKLIHKYSEG